VSKKFVETTGLPLVENGNVTGSADNPSRPDNRIDNRSPGTLSAYSDTVGSPL